MEVVVIRSKQAKQSAAAGAMFDQLVRTLRRAE
jgi:hypothetical protein